MSTTKRSITRAQRVAKGLGEEKLLDQLSVFFFTENGLLKITLLLATALILSFLIHAWNPPFKYSLMKRVERDVVCRVPFSVLNMDKTKEARMNVRLDTPHIYAHDHTKLEQFKIRLTNTIQSLLAVENFAAMKNEDREKWRLFLPPNCTDEEASQSFARLQKTLEKDIEAKRFRQALDSVFKPYESNGILIKLHSSRDGNMERIAVYDLNGSIDNLRYVSVRDVLIGNAYLIKDRLNQEFERPIADLLFHWIRPAIPETLTENREMTIRAQNLAVAAVRDVYTQYEPGQVIVKGGNIIDGQAFNILSSEYQTLLSLRTWSNLLLRWLGAFVLIFIMLLFTYMAIYSRIVQCKKSHSLKNAFILFGLLLIFVALGRVLQIFFENQGANPELIPLLVFAQLITLAYSWEVAIIISFVASLILSMSGLFELGRFMVIVGTIAVVIFFARDIKKRSHLIAANCYGGFIAFVLSLSVGLLRDNDHNQLVMEAFLRLLWVILAGFFMTGLLPFFERLCGILTPMRLLEIGNPSHPLLQELARRAPATYNHSMQTAAIAEAAAESIGVRGALVRVGAYFHDIGKMLNPKHFTENQEKGEQNIHDVLEPRVSTLVIVAHVKDGVDMAHRYHLPEPIIDLIEQHHGTMLASFFYEKANKANIAKYGQPLDKSEFRYPGPEPQSKEAGILMLADAVESASRSLTEDATPGRIEGFVRKIVEQRMEDGQFDESGLSLGELRVIEKSIINSVLASKHSRIAYPDKNKISPAPSSSDIAKTNGKLE